jgi:hypothetical protein
VFVAAAAFYFWSGIFDLWYSLSRWRTLSAEWLIGTAIAFPLMLAGSLVFSVMAYRAWLER